MSEIKFGADGWTAVIARDFTFENCRKVAQGIASYVNNNNLHKKGIVIGYDNRFLSREFAEECAQVLVGNGIKVFLPRKAVPAPVAAFAVRFLQAGGAVMITASHYPPQYNGIRFIPEYAGPAMPDIVEAIESEVRRVLDGGKIYSLNLKEAVQLELFREIDADKEYMNHLIKIIKADSFGNSYIKVVVDPMYGSGTGYMDKILSDLGCEVKTINNYRDVLFGGFAPSPGDNNLSDLKRAVFNYNADIGLAVDGDADRFGLIDKDGEFISPNRFAGLLLIHLLKTRNFRGPVCRSVATTHILDRVAQKNGLDVIETPVDFRYISEALRQKGCILGCEERGYLSILGHIPYNDGILACLLAVEMLAYSGKSVAELTQELIEEYGNVVNERFDIDIEDGEKDAIRDKLSNFSPKAISGVKVLTCNRLEGNKIFLEDGSWILLCMSGKEPVLRVHIEAGNKSTLKQLREGVIKALGLEG